MIKFRKVSAIFIDCEGLREMGRTFMMGNNPPDTVTRPINTIDSVLRPPAVMAENPPCVVVYKCTRVLHDECGNIAMVEFEETYRGSVEDAPSLP